MKQNPKIQNIFRKYNKIFDFLKYRNTFANKCSLMGKFLKTSLHTEG